MNIKWNEVTWYSKLFSALFLLIVFPAVVFHIGILYEQSRTEISSGEEAAGMLPSNDEVFLRLYGSSKKDARGCFTWVKNPGNEKGDDLLALERERDTKTSIEAACAEWPIVRVLYQKVLQEQGAERYYVLTEASFCPAHVCGATLGAIVFEKRSGEWVLLGANSGVREMGAFGHLVEPKAVVVGPDNKTGFLFEGGYGNMGYFMTRADLLVFDSGSFSFILNLYPTGESNGASGEEDPSKLFDYSSELLFDPTSSGTYFDLNVFTTGTRLQGTKVVSVNETTRYRFNYQDINNPRYERVEN